MMEHYAKITVFSYFREKVPSSVFDWILKTETFQMKQRLDQLLQLLQRVTFFVQFLISKRK